MRKSLILLVILLALPVAAQWRRANLFGADIRALIVDPASPDLMSEVAAYGTAVIVRPRKAG